MAPLLGILLRLTLTYFYLLALVRLAGKRSLGEATPFDFLVAIIIGDFPDDVIWGDVPLAQGVVGIGTIMLLHLIVAYCSYRSIPFDQMVGSKPEPLIEQGQFLPQAMGRQRLSKRDVEAMLRLQGIDSPQEVKRATLEPNGDLSVIRRDPNQFAEKRDLSRLREALP